MGGRSTKTCPPTVHPASRKPSIGYHSTQQPCAPEESQVVWFAVGPRPSAQGMHAAPLPPREYVLPPHSWHDEPSRTTPSPGLQSGTASGREHAWRDMHTCAWGVVKIRRRTRSTLPTYSPSVSWSIALDGCTTKPGACTRLYQTFCAANPAVTTAQDRHFWVLKCFQMHQSPTLPTHHRW